MDEFSSRNDSELLRLARRDARAFAEFYRRHAGSVYRSALQSTGSTEVASDLTAEAFAEALRRVEGFRGARPASGSAWIHTIAESLVRQYRRSLRIEDRARQRIGIDLDMSAEVDGEVAERLDALASGSELERLLEELPRSQRAVVRMRVVGEASYEEIATTLGMTQTTARQQLRRGLTQLRTTFRIQDGTS